MRSFFSPMCRWPLGVVTVLVAAWLLPSGSAVSVAAAAEPRTGAPLREVGSTDGPSISLVADLQPGAKSSAPSALRAVHGDLFFMANGAGAGNEPWVTDGTPEGTRLIGDIYTGPSFAESRAIAPTSDGTLLSLQSFGEGDDWAGSLWFTTTTAAADGVTNPVLDWGPRFTTAALRFEDDALIWISDFQSTSGLWRTDGTPEGTRLVKGGMVTYQARFAKAEDQVFFLDTQSVLAVTDGTRAGTRRVRTWGDTYQGSILVGRLLSAGRYAFFDFVGAPAATGNELWVSDGTTKGTHLLKDINPGPASAQPSWFTRLGSELFFVADDGSHGRELWRSDGTTAGTVRITDQPSTRMPDLTKCRDRLYFVTASEKSSALWSTSGNRGDVRKIVNLPGGVSEWKDRPRDLTCLPNGLLFTLDDGLHGREPWTWSRGTQTVHLHDLLPGDRSSRPTEITRVGNETYFRARDLEHGQELWVVKS